MTGDVASVKCCCKCYLISQTPDDPDTLKNLLSGVISKATSDSITRSAITYLTTNISGEGGHSVMSLAVLRGAAPLVEEFFCLPNIYRFSDDSHIKYDITLLTPDTTMRSTGDTSIKPAVGHSILEQFLDSVDKDGPDNPAIEGRAAQVLNLKLFRFVVDNCRRGVNGYTE